MLNETREIDSPENLIKYIEESGIIPHRMIDISPYFGPSFEKIQVESDSYLDVFFKYIDNNKAYLIKNFQNIRFEDVFGDDDEFFESMTNHGRYNFINEEEPRCGAFRISHENYEFSYRLDFKLLEKQFSESMPDFNFPKFADFMNDCADFWNIDNPKLIPESLAKAGFEFEFCKNEVQVFCNFANHLFSFYKTKMTSFSRRWHCIEYSQDPFYFSNGKGLYYILFISQSDDLNTWDIVEFICDY